MDFLVYGNLPSKANQYEISIKKGKPSFRKKDHIVAYERAFLSQIWPEFDFTFCDASELPDDLMIHGEFELRAHVYYKNSVHDLDNAFKMFLDCCEMAKLIENDKYCTHIEAWKHVDRVKPRVEFTLIKL